jgi:hypothetical protein
MRLHYLTLCLGLLAFGACGGGSSGSSAPASPAPGASAGGGGGGGSEFGKTENGLPGWLNRGSTAVTKDGKRAFYGVGMASGIKNAPLLRSTCDNRARNEISKLLEVFSASLMKDYMASTTGSDPKAASEEQHVEQAIKTANAGMLSGVEIVDRYIDKDGGMYSLAKLDLETMAAAIAKAKELGAFKSYTEKVSLDDMFDKSSKKQTPPPPPPPVSGTAAAAAPEAKPPAANTSSAKSSKGKKPGWVEGEDANFPRTTYLCGVGFGPDRTAAENGAYAALAKIFVANVAQMSQDFMGAYSKTGAPSLEVQSSETLTKVSTSKMFTGVELKEVWEDTGKKVTYGLACLDRAKESKRLRDLISTADSKAGSFLDKSNAAGDKVGKMKYLAQAMDAVLEREAQNVELRLVEVDGTGIGSPYAPADVASQLEAAVSAIKIGVRVEGAEFTDDFKSAFIEGLKKRSYEVTDLSGGEEPGLDVLVNVKVSFENEEGGGAAKGMLFARGVAIVEVKNLEAGKVITSLTERHKEGHKSFTEAQRKAVRWLGKNIVDKLGGKIDDAMKGR